MPAKKYTPPSDDEIACCAFAIIAREYPHLAQAKWREAAAQLILDRQHDAGLLNDAPRRGSSAQRQLCAA